MLWYYWENEQVRDEVGDPRIRNFSIVQRISLSRVLGASRSTRATAGTVKICLGIRLCQLPILVHYSQRHH